MRALGVSASAHHWNHDSNRTAYPAFNMGGERYYTYVIRTCAFFVIDSNQMDPANSPGSTTSAKEPADDKDQRFHHPLG
jgi:hypothetical protein